MKKIVLVLLAVLALGLFGACQGEGAIFSVCYETVGGGRIEGERTQTVAAGEDAAEVRAVANEGCYFAGWSDGVKSETRQDRDLRGDLKVTAVFEKRGLSVRYEAGEGGQVSGAAEQTVRYGENASAVTAVPEEGYEFVGWSDGVQTATRQDQGIRGNLFVTAEFRLRTFLVRYEASAGGKIQGITEQTVTWGGYGPMVQAKADAGYEFLGWSDGVKSAIRQDLDIRGDLSVRAIFDEEKFDLIYSAGEGGRIEGERVQRVKEGEDGLTVTAVPEEGYEFVRWTDGVQTAERQEVGVKSDLSVSAIFAEEKIRVNYLSNDLRLGWVIDLEENMNTVGVDVAYGADGPVVRAEPRADGEGKEYVFLGWSDGVMTEERQDRKVLEEMTVTALFGYRTEYVVDGGGRIEGNASQKVLPDGTGEKVKAVPADGYVFTGWSDLTWNPERQDATRNRNEEYVAYFEPIQRTFRLDYGTESLLASKITLERERIWEAEFPVPARAGHTFLGWYADRDYRIRITTENGRYMYGYAAFTLETDTLYARWQPEGEKTDPHKILLVFVDEIDAELYWDAQKKTVNVHSKMQTLDYRMSKWVAETMQGLLNEWFEGKQRFEIDSYYTTKVVRREDFPEIPREGLFADKLPETAYLTHFYHNTLLTYGLDDYQFNLRGHAGLAGRKNAYVCRETYWPGKNFGGNGEEYLEAVQSGELGLANHVFYTYLHEFTHTAENYFPDDHYHNLHGAEAAGIDSGVRDFTEVIRQFLLNEFFIEGERCGVPIEYWEHEIEIPYNYVAKACDKRTAGEIAIIGMDGNRYELEQGYAVGEVAYGGELTMEAVPYEGYRFVRWSDGVTTALRHDVNIISYINVQAIFEKI